MTDGSTAEGRAQRKKNKQTMDLKRITIEITQYGQ